MKQVMIAFVALVLMSGHAQAGFFDFIFKGNSHQHHHSHHHHDKHRKKLAKLIKKIKKKHADKHKCRHNNFRSWRELERSNAVSIQEDANSITVTSDCELRFQPLFSYETDKVLTIDAKKVEFSSLSKLEAARMILVADKLETAKHSKLCAEIVVLEAERAKHRGRVCDSAQVLGSVVGQPSAIANLSVQLASEFVPAQVSFDWRDSFGVYTEAQLELGNGQSVSTSEKSYSHLYEDAGEYSAQVRLQTPGGEALSAPASFILKAEEVINPIADFTLMHTIHYAGTPLEVWLYPSLYPLVSGSESIKEYRYDFGDGSSVVVPAALFASGFIPHTYAEAGAYTVRLEVVTVSGHSKVVEQEVVLDNPTNPAPKYQVSSFKGQAPLTVDFSGLGYDLEDDSVTHRWVMPDSGAQFTSANVQYTFANEGVYYVRYEVLDQQRGHRVTYVPIYVGDNLPATNALAPVSVIDSSARFGQLPLTVDFSGVRSFDPNQEGAPLSYEWEFGDWDSGELNFASSVNAQHTFNRSGSYFVTLRVTNAAGQQHTEFIYVYVDGPEVNDIDFAVTPTGNPYEFYFDGLGFFAESDYTRADPIWDFGDNTFGNYPNLIYQYAGPGTYDVELKMRRADGEYQSYTRRLEVSDDMIVPMISLEGQSGGWFNVGEETTLSVNFLAGASSERTTYRWLLGDGSIIKGQGEDFSSVAHAYDLEESMQVRLMITADNGLTSQTEYWLQPNRYAPEINGLTIYGLENPVAPARLGFAPHETTVDHDGNLSHFIYEFGDGSAAITTHEGYLEHDYPNAGTYTVAVTAVDVTGLQTRFETQIELKENQAPVLADFDISYDGSAAPALVNIAAFTFINDEYVPYATDSDGWIVAHEFDWGDGNITTTGTDAFADHLYTDYGSFTVRMRAQDNSGAWSNYVTKTLTINANQAPVIAHVPIYGNLTEPAPVRLGFAPHEGTSDDQYIERWSYDFGDGSPVLETLEGYAEHEYLFPGNFTVVVTAFDPQGLSSSYSIPLEIKANQPPVLADVNIYFPDDNNSKWVEFEAGSFAVDSDGYIQEITFNLSDGSSYITSNGFFQGELAAGDYTVSAVATDDKGATASITKDFTVLESYIPVVDFEVATEGLHVPVTLAFDGRHLVTDRDNNILGYSWDVEGQVIQTPEAFLEWTFITVGPQTVTLTVVDGGGNQVSASKSFEVLPNQPPIANFELEKETIDIFEVFGLDGATLSSDPENRGLGYQWFIDNEFVSSEAIFAHYFETEGTRTIRLMVTDDSQNTVSTERVLNVVDSGSLQVLPVITAFNENEVIEETLYLSAEDSDFNNQEIASIQWTINDAEVYDGLVTSYTPEVYGEVKVTLKITSTLGLSKEVTKYFNVQAREILAEEIESSHLASITGIDENRLHNLSEQITISLDGGTFDAEQVLSYLRINGEEVAFINQTTHITAALTLVDGINLIEYRFFDENSNFVSDELTIYAGSGALNINLYDLASNLVNESDIEIFVSVAKKQSVNKRFSVNGPSFELQGLPVGEELILSLGGERFVFGDRYTLASAVEAKDLYVTTSLPLTASSSLPLDQSFTDWTVENLNFDSNQARFVMPSGGYALLKRRVEITEEHPALNANFDLRFNNDKEYAVYTVKNITSGYLTSFSRSIRDSVYSPVENQEFNTALSVSLGIKLGDVVEIEARFYRPEEQTSFISKLVNAWAQSSTSSSSYGLSCQVGSPLLHFDLLEFNPELDPDDHPRRFNRLEAFSISQVIGGYEGNSNEVFVRARFDDSYVASTEVFPLITAYLYGLKLSSTFDSSYYSVRADASNPIICISETGSALLKCNGTTEEVLLRNFTQTDFNLRNFNGHTDMNLDVLYSLASPLDPELQIENCDDEVVKCQNVASAHREGGPFKILRRYTSNVHRFINSASNFTLGEGALRFAGPDDPRDEVEGLDDWMSLGFEDVLRYLLNSNRGVKFNDISNVDGGRSADHKGHDNGQEIDLALRNHSGTRFRKEDFYELQNIFNNPIMDRVSVPSNSSTYGIFATFGEGDHALEMKKFVGNRCLGVRSASKYILDIEGHKTHLHISTRDNGADKFAGTQRRAFDQNTQDALKNLENSFTIDADKNVIYDFNLSDIALDIVKVTYSPASASDPREERVYKHLFSSDKSGSGINFAPGFELNSSASVFNESLGRYTRLVLKVDPRIAEPTNSLWSKIEFRVHRLTTNVCYSAKFNLPPACLNPDNTIQPGRYLSSGAFVADSATVSEQANLGREVVVCDESQVGSNAIIQGRVRLKKNTVIGSCNVYIDGPTSGESEFLIQGDVEIGNVSCSGGQITAVSSSGGSSKIVGNNIRIGTNLNLINPSIEGDNISIMPSTVSGYSGYIENTRFRSNVTLTNLVNINNSTFSNAIIASGVTVDSASLPRLYLAGATVLGSSATIRASASGYGFVRGRITGTGSFSGSGSVAADQPPTEWIVPALNGALENSFMSGNGIVSGYISNGTTLSLSSIGGYCAGDSYSTRGSIIAASIGTGHLYSGVIVIHGGTNGQLFYFSDPCDDDPVRVDL